MSEKYDSLKLITSSIMSIQHEIARRSQDATMPNKDDINNPMPAILMPYGSMTLIVKLLERMYVAALDLALEEKDHVDTD